MSPKKQAALIAVVLLATLALHLSIAWQDIGTLSRNGFLYDDSYYAFQIARNAAAGKGFTFDGVHPTTGFQPLYVFILVPVFMISQGSATLPIYFALSMLACFTTLTAYLVYRICRRYTGFAASLAAAAVWALSPVVARQGTNGLETAMATFMIALSVYFYLSRIRGERDPGLSKFLVLGALLGGTVLTRIDGIFLVLVIALDYLVLLKRRKEAAGAVSRVVLMGAGVAALYGPWLAVNILQSGTALQDSGSATRFLSLAYATYFQNGKAGLAASGPDASFIWEQVRHAVSTMKVIPPLHAVFRGVDKVGAALGMYDLFHSAGNIFGIAALGWAGYKVFRWKEHPGRKERRELDFLVLFSLLLVLSYSLYIFGAFFFMRYFYPVYLAACVYLAFFLQDFFGWISARRATLRRAAVTAAAAYLMLFISFSYFQVFRAKPVYPFYDIARWVRENTTRDECVGVFQCGTIGYFSNRKTINLDGKVNREALGALKRDKLQDYIKNEEIDIILDHSKILSIFLKTPPERLSKVCERILTGSDSKWCGWIAIRKNSLIEIIDSQDSVGVQPSFPVSRLSE